VVDSVEFTSEEAKQWMQRMVAADGTLFMRVFSELDGVLSFEDVDTDGAIISPVGPVHPIRDVDSAFTPRALAGDARFSMDFSYYDASVEGSVWQDAAMTIPAVNTGDPVRVWADLSGRQRHLTEKVGYSPPTLVVSGRTRWVVGNGTDQALEASSFGFAGSKELSCYAGVQGPAPSRSRPVVSVSDNSGSASMDGDAAVILYRGDSGSGPNWGVRSGGGAAGILDDFGSKCVTETLVGHIYCWVRVYMDGGAYKHGQAGGYKSNRYSNINGQFLTLFQAVGLNDLSDAGVNCFAVFNGIPPMRYQQLLRAWAAERVWR